MKWAIVFRLSTVLMLIVMMTYVQTTSQMSDYNQSDLESNLNQNNKSFNNTQNSKSKHNMYQTLESEEIRITSLNGKEITKIPDFIQSGENDGLCF